MTFLVAISKNPSKSTLENYLLLSAYFLSTARPGGDVRVGAARDECSRMFTVRTGNRQMPVLNPFSSFQLV